MVLARPGVICDTLYCIVLCIIVGSTDIVHVLITKLRRQGEREAVQSNLELQWFILPEVQTTGGSIYYNDWEAGALQGRVRMPCHRR